MRSLNSVACKEGPVRQKPFSPWPHFETEEIEAAVKVLSSGKINYWTGEEGRLFEREFAQSTGRRYAVALANGTVALELALYSLELGAGAEILVPSRTFVASASCALIRGAVPVFADVDKHSQNVTRDTLAAALTPGTRAIIAVHLAGWPCDMDPILSFATEHGLKVIEDCAQAHGATYKGRPVGSMGDVATFSFCQDKILTTAGEGGMLTTNDEKVWERAWSFKDHGKNYAAISAKTRDNGFQWVHDRPGTNWRLTEVQSAVGRVGLKKLPEWVQQRRRLARILNQRLSVCPGLRTTIPPDWVEHAYYKYYCFVRPEALRPGWDRDRILGAIRAEGIPCFTGSCSEVYLEKAFPHHLQPAKPLPTARELGETSLMLLVHPTLNEQDMFDTCEAVEKVMTVAAR